MPCYKPLLMYHSGYWPETGKKAMTLLGPCRTLDYWDPESKIFSEPWHDPDRLFRVPCNRCIGCRLDYARQWSNRLVLELQDNPNALFITLTYNDQNVPISEKGFKTVSVRDCQLFMKRLRKHFSDRKIRFFLCSEYGSTTLRPHYHGIFYGLSLSDFPDLEFYKFNKLNQPLYKSDLLAKEIWKNGFCTIGGVTRESCSYTARYMLKKLKGPDSLFYSERAIAPEFTLSSRRPGIGFGYLESNPEFTNEISVFDGEKIVSFPMPKKLLEKYGQLHPDEYNTFKEARKVVATSAELLEYNKTDLDYLEYLDLKESAIYRKIKGISADTRLDL